MSETATKSTGRPKGASPTFTEAQMLAAIKRVYATCGSCTQEDYTALRMDSEPSERTIRCRFGTFNKAKVAAGLPCTVRKRHSAHNLMRGLPAAPTSFYPCWRCKKKYTGRGRKQGDYFCSTCREQVNEMAANMAWLG